MEHTVKGQGLAKMEKEALTGKVGHLFESRARVGGKWRDRGQESQGGFSVSYRGVPTSLCLVCP